MTQLYVGNLNEHGDEKNIRVVFNKYGTVREVLMKSGYAFVEMETALQAEHVMRELNGTDILGHPMIVEPSHQQRLSTRSRRPVGIVEVTNIPTNMTLEGIENFFSQTIAQVVKIEIEDNQPADFGAKRILVSFDNPELATRAASLYGNEDSPLRCTVVEDLTRPGSAGTMKNGGRRSNSIPNSPSKGSNEFPLRILVPADMVGAIIGKDGATIRNITQLTKARVDVHRRENLGSMEKAITIIGSPESCTEACYQIMQIMQNELLMTSNNGSIFDHNKHHFDPTIPGGGTKSYFDPMKPHYEPLPVVPLKILAHNELVGRVIGKAGNTLKRIMAESGTKITISKLKDLTAYNMERTITILGTIDNCKKAESLISAKLRASYESDMTQFMNCTGPSDNSPTHSNSPPHSLNGGGDMPKPVPVHPHSLPATPTAVRTFQDFSHEHTRLLSTLHGSTGTLEVNGLGGFYSSVKNGSNGTPYTTPIDPMVNGYPGDPSEGGGNPMNPAHTTSSGPPMGGPMPPTQQQFQMNRSHSVGDDDLTDVLQGLSLHNARGGGSGKGFQTGYNRMMGPVRRTSAPTQNGPMLGWSESIIEESPVFSPSPSAIHQSKFMTGFTSGWTSTGSSNTIIGSSAGTGPPHPPPGTQLPQAPPTSSSQQQQQQRSSNNSGDSIWSPSFSSRPESELSSYQDSDGSNGFSPIYSPVSAVTSGFFEPFPVISSSSQQTIASTQFMQPKPSPSPVVDSDQQEIFKKESVIAANTKQQIKKEDYLDSIINDTNCAPPIAPPTSNGW